MSDIKGSASVSVYGNGGCLDWKCPNLALTYAADGSERGQDATGWKKWLHCRTISGLVIRVI